MRGHREKAEKERHVSLAVNSGGQSWELQEERNDTTRHKASEDDEAIKDIAVEFKLSCDDSGNCESASSSGSTGEVPEGRVEAVEFKLSCDDSGNCESASSSGSTGEVLEGSSIDLEAPEPDSSQPSLEDPSDTPINNQKNSTVSLSSDDSLKRRNKSMERMDWNKTYTTAISTSNDKVASESGSIDAESGEHGPVESVEFKLSCDDSGNCESTSSSGSMGEVLEGSSIDLQAPEAESSQPFLEEPSDTNMSPDDVTSNDVPSSANDAKQKEFPSGNDQTDTNKLPDDALSSDDNSTGISSPNDGVASDMGSIDVDSGEPHIVELNDPLELSDNEAKLLNKTLERIGSNKTNNTGISSSNNEAAGERGSVDADSGKHGPVESVESKLSNNDSDNSESTSASGSSGEVLEGSSIDLQAPEPDSSQPSLEEPSDTPINNQKNSTISLSSNDSLKRRNESMLRMDWNNTDTTGISISNDKVASDSGSIDAESGEHGPVESVESKLSNNDSGNSESTSSSGSTGEVLEGSSIDLEAPELVTSQPSPSASRSPSPSPAPSPSPSPSHSPSTSPSPSPSHSPSHSPFSSPSLSLSSSPPTSPPAPSAASYTMFDVLPGAFRWDKSPPTPPPAASAASHKMFDVLPGVFR